MKKKNKEQKFGIGEVYVFHNTMFNFNMFINAEGIDEAMHRFDQCGFTHRKQWKIMVELDQQPSEGPDEKTNNK